MIDTLKAGTPLFKKHTVYQPEGNLNTAAVRPAQGKAAHTEFVGVTLHEGEKVDSERGKNVSIQRYGVALARVYGQVSAGQQVGRLVTNPGNQNEALAPYLSPQGDVMVGVARQSVPAGEERLIRVELQPQQETFLTQARVVGVYDNVLICVPLGDVAAEFMIEDIFGAGLYPGIFVAKPRTLRTKWWKPGWEAGNPGNNQMNRLDHAAFDANGSTNFLYEPYFSFRNVNGSMRYRIQSPSQQPGAQGQQNIIAHNMLRNFLIEDSNGDPVKYETVSRFSNNYDFLEVFEVIDPPYAPDYSTPTRAKVSEKWANWINIARFPHVVEVTPDDQSWVDAGFDNKPVYWADLNTDARRFTSPPESMDYVSIGDSDTLIPKKDYSVHSHDAASPATNGLFGIDNDVPNPPDSIDLGIGPTTT